MAELKKATNLRKSQIVKMKDLYTIAKKAESDTNSVSLFKIWYEEIDFIKEAFFAHHNVIIGSASDNEFDEEDHIRKDFDKQFYEIKTIYYRLQQTTTPLQSVENDSVSNISLPKIQLSTFNGDITTFPSYIEMFDALIGNNLKLTDIEKFNYLLSSIKGPALALVRNLPMTSANYKIAYDTLVKRYKNSRLIAAAHWASIENTTKLNSNNSVELRNLLDVFSENLAALKSLKFPVEHWDFILVQMLLNRIDVSIATRFELQHNSPNTPSYKDLFDFLSKHCSALDNLNLSKKCKTQKKVEFPKSQFSARSTTSLHVQTDTSSCILCKSDHMIYKCPDFVKKTPQDRYQLAKNLKLCINCLKPTHSSKNCKSGGCRRCGERHHTALHFNQSSEASKFSVEPCREMSENGQSSSSSAITTQSTSSSDVVPSMHAGFLSHPSNVLLATARVEVLDSQGGYQPLRCLLDSGSMTSFITQQSVQRLGLRTHTFSAQLNGLGSMSSFVNNGGVALAVRPVKQGSPILKFDAIVLTKICCNLPPSKLAVHKNWPYLSNIKLADPEFYIPGRIDILLGADTFSQILTHGHIVGSNGEPDALNTIFGYVLIGKFNHSDPSPPSVSSLLCPSSKFVHLEDLVKRFWELERVPEIRTRSAEDEMCEQIFLSTHKRSEEGRFILHYPFRDSSPTFPGSRNLALRRFYALENRLLKRPEIYKLYCSFMKEYIELNHMELVSSSEESPHNYYIPHHCVLRPDSQTTKLRVVFNASAKQSGQLSLNDNLLVGEKLQRDIVTILLNFRLHAVVMTTDVKMMYRQILISPSQRDYQRILWRFSQEEAVQIYRLMTVTYGVTSSPFLAIRTLLQLAEDHKSEFPLAAKVLASDTFVDDIVTGSASVQEALSLQTQLIALLKKGGFELRKWSSNDPAILDHLPKSHLGLDAFSFDSELESSQKVLGLQWNPSLDCFKFSLHPIIEASCTKRNLLSNLARIFDPLGYLSPITFRIKCLIQQLWTYKIGWDQEAPHDIVRTWEKYSSDISSVSKLNLPRLLVPQEYSICQLHCFGDASEKGYCAVGYLVFYRNSGETNTQFVCAKSKVAPLKTVSLPRLELCAAVLVSKLVAFICNIFKDKLNFEKIVCWSDSTVVLHWINSSPHRWKTFVGNRVAVIQNRVPSESWLHVCSGENPADIGSRGLLPTELLHSSLWWAGPPILRSSYPELPTETGSLDPPTEEVLKEERVIVLTTTTSTPNVLDTLLHNHSSLSKSIRILSYVLRFMKGESRLSYLTSNDLHRSLFKFVKNTQAVYFAEEIRLLKLGHSLPKVLQKLSPFLDNEGILRVGGRLRHAPLPFARKYPALLPSRSRLTDLIIEHTHLKYFHVGVQTVQYLISQKFWILSSKRSIRRILSKCLKCWRVNPSPLQPPMGDLPSERVSQMKPFLHVGVDYAGPFTITMSKFRGAKTTKAYLCLFICFATKAVHLELASDLSSEAFLAALRRFIARRGRCQSISSDGGTNFVGAYRQLNSYLSSAASHEAIRWKRIPPSGPNFGGLWEAGVKSVKTHLVRIVGDQVLTYEELLTVLVQIEAILNSRPLTPFSNDPNDISALTPGHFLTLEPLTASPESDLRDVAINRLSRWQLLVRMHQDFWDRWSKEYLHTLNQKVKWTDNKSPPIKNGALVLIKCDNVPPLKWQLGRIHEVFPGTDGHIRVASVKTANNILRRPVSKLCPLPLES